MLVDLTTTSVGRRTLLRTYAGFFANVRFGGRFRVVVTVDPAYAVARAELDETVEFLTGLPDRYPAVQDVVVERFDRPVGLPGALSVLLAHTTAEFGVHLEDDWEITGPIDLDGLVGDLRDQRSTAIVLGNEHAAQGGTFDRPAEAVPVPGTRVPLLRLTGASWARHYLPLCPHLHATERWAPAVARALALTDDARCPEERVREHLIDSASTASHNVLWTRDVVARDIGRDWLAERRRHKAVTPLHAATLATPLPASVGRPAGRGPSRADTLAARSAKLPARPPAYGGHPEFLERGAGAVVWDVDGNGYVDLRCADGAATLGHSHPVITNTVREQSTAGLRLAPSSPAELTVAELVVAAVPGATAARLLPTETAALTTAIDLSRRHSGRADVLLVGPVYAPGRDRLLLDTTADEQRVLGRLAETAPAAVVLASPYERRLGREFLGEVRRLCDARDVVLVLDETVTGLRLAPGGLGEFLGVVPDLACLGVGMAGGAPIAAVAGRADLLAGPVDTGPGAARRHVDRLALALAKSVLRHLATSDFAELLATLGKRLRDGVNEHAGAAGLPPMIVGYDQLPCLRLSAGTEDTFVPAMARQGVLLRSGVNFLSAAHDVAHVDFVIAAAAAALAEIREPVR